MTHNTNNFKKAVEALMGFLAALTIQNAVSEICHLHFVPGPIIYQIPPMTWLSFFTCITLSVRFFIGNFQYFNSETINDITELTVDSLTIILQSAILAFASYFIHEQGQFFLYVAFLFLVDLIWFFFTLIRANILRESVVGHKQMAYNQLVSCGTMLALFFLILDYNEKQASIHHPILLVIIIAFNLVLDSLINYRRYLGLSQPLPAQNGGN